MGQLPPGKAARDKGNPKGIPNPPSPAVEAPLAGLSGLHRGKRGGWVSSGGCTPALCSPFQLGAEPAPAGERRTRGAARLPARPGAGARRPPRAAPPQLSGPSLCLPGSPRPFPSGAEPCGKCGAPGAESLSRQSSAATARCRGVPRPLGAGDALQSRFQATGINRQIFPSTASLLSASLCCCCCSESGKLSRKKKKRKKKVAVDVSGLLLY